VAEAPLRSRDATARVLVVEDHAVIRGVIRLACEHAQDLEVIGEVETGEDALAAIEALERDYARHAGAARSIAERYFDSDLVLARLLERLTSQRASA
jgi:CheY-like chemotaxis protein